MFYKENTPIYLLPLYDVTELTMEEALLVLSAEKEANQPPMNSLRDTSGHEMAATTILANAI